MNKKFVAIVLCSAMLFSVSACSKSGDNTDGAPVKSARPCVSKITPAKADKPDTDAVKPVAEGNFPAVTAGANFGEKPTVSVGQGEPPKQLERKILIKGDGAEITSHMDVTVNYLGQLWQGGVFDNSYDRKEPATFNLRQVIKGWTWGLTGAHVGDRLELVIPPELGYGDKAQGDKLPANSTLVFIVDVLFAPPQLNENQLAGITQLLARSVPTSEKLPEGLEIYCKPGQEPQLAFVAGSKVPTKPSVTWETTGKGEKITDKDIIGIVGVNGTWGAEPESSWTNGSGISYFPAKGTYAVGKTVGSRLVLVGPPSPQAPRGVVQVADIVSATPINK